VTPRNSYSNGSGNGYQAQQQRSSSFSSVGSASNRPAYNSSASYNPTTNGGGYGMNGGGNYGGYGSSSNGYSNGMSSGSHSNGYDTDNKYSKKPKRKSSGPPQGGFAIVVGAIILFVYSVMMTTLFFSKRGTVNSLLKKLDQPDTFAVINKVQDLERQLKNAEVGRRTAETTARNKVTGELNRLERENRILSDKHEELTDRHLPVAEAKIEKYTKREKAFMDQVGFLMDQTRRESKRMVLERCVGCVKECYRFAVLCFVPCLRSIIPACLAHAKAFFLFVPLARSSPNCFVPFPNTLRIEHSPASSFQLPVCFFVGDKQLQSSTVDPFHTPGGKKTQSTISFGPGPHKVQITFAVPTSDKNEEKPRHNFVIDLAPLNQVPHAIHLFLEQVDHGLLEGTHFYLNGPHIVQAGPQPDWSQGDGSDDTYNEHADVTKPSTISGSAVNTLEKYELAAAEKKRYAEYKYDDDAYEPYYSAEEYWEEDKRTRKFQNLGLDQLAFPDYSEDYPHSPWTVGFTGRPGGPDWYINKVDNTKGHGPGGQPQHELEEQGDSCFGTISMEGDGRNKIAQHLYSSDIYGDSTEWHHFISKPIEIVYATILTKEPILDRHLHLDHLHSQHKVYDFRRKKGEEKVVNRIDPDGVHEGHQPHLHGAAEA
jgi:hypothetical protein